MKLRTSFLFSLRELRHNYPLFFLCCLLMVSIVTTGLFLVSADESLMHSFYNYTIKMGNAGNGLRVYFSGPYETRYLVEDMPFEVVFLGEEDDYGKNYLYRGISLEDYRGSVVSLYSDSYNMNDPVYQIIDGIALTKECDEDRNIWISDTIRNEFGCRIGDCINRKMPNGKEYEYEIKGVFSASSGHIGDFYLSEKPFYRDLIDAGYTRQVEFTGVLLHPEEYHHIKTVLNSRHIPAWTDLDDEFVMLALIDILLKSLFVMILMLSMFVVYNTCKITIYNRLAFFMRLRMLGARTEGIMVIYEIILESIILISFLVAYFLNRVFMNYVKAIVSKVIPDIYFISADCLIYAFWGFLICSFILFAQMFYFKKRYDCGNISEALLDG